MLVNTNKQRLGKVQIEKVAKMKSEKGEVFDETIGAIGDISESIVECLGLDPHSEEPVDQRELMDLVTMDQNFLEAELDVSGEDINKIVETMMQHEVHGKLTGAGGDGGCVLGFYIKESGEENQN